METPTYTPTPQPTFDYTVTPTPFVPIEKTPIGEAFYHIPMKVIASETIKEKTLWLQGSDGSKFLVGHYTGQPIETFEYQFPVTEEVATGWAELFIRLVDEADNIGSVITQGKTLYIGRRGDLSARIENNYQLMVITDEIKQFLLFQRNDIAIKESAEIKAEPILVTREYQIAQIQAATNQFWCVAVSSDWVSIAIAMIDSQLLQNSIQVNQTEIKLNNSVLANYDIFSASETPVFWEKLKPWLALPPSNHPNRVKSILSEAIENEYNLTTADQLKIREEIIKEFLRDLDVNRDGIFGPEELFIIKEIWGQPIEKLDKLLDRYRD